MSVCNEYAHVSQTEISQSQYRSARRRFGRQDKRVLSGTIAPFFVVAEAGDIARSFL
jgi:hypothetical protein